MKSQKKKIDKRIFKKSPEELQQYMIFKRRGSRVENRKGKGSFKRKLKFGFKEEIDFFKKICYNIYVR